MNIKTVVTTVFLSTICHWGIAQQQPNTIQVTARMIYADPEPTFKSEITLSTAYAGVESDTITMNQMKERFKNALAEKGISWEGVKEHAKPFGFETMGYNQEGIIYVYETKSVEEMKKFLTIKLPTLQRQSATSVIELDTQEAEKIVAMVLEKSNKKAALLAKVMKRNVGKIVSISENTRDLIGKPYETVLFYDRTPGEFYYDLVVVYELE